MEILLRLEDSAPRLQRHHLVRLGAATSASNTPTRELVFRISKVVEPSSSDTVSLDPTSTDQGAAPITGDTSGLRGGGDRLEDTVPVGNNTLDGRALENPRSVVSSSRQEEHVMSI